MFDELEKSQSHLLLDQMERYFQRSHKGRERSSYIIPEPFFVHSDLTSAVQIADLLAYTISWGVRFGRMDSPARPELEDLADLVMKLRYCALRTINGQDSPWEIWSFTHIEDLRPRESEA